MVSRQEQQSKSFFQEFPTFYVAQNSLRTLDYQFGCNYWIRLSCTYSPEQKKSLNPINDELNTNPIDNIRTKCLLKQHKQQHLFPCRTLITSNPHDVRFKSLFSVPQIIVHSKFIRAQSESIFQSSPNRRSRPGQNHLIRGGSSFLIAGVIVPARDPDLDLGDRVDLGRDVLEALVYFLVEAVAYPSRKLGIIGAVGTVSISSYAGGRPWSKLLLVPLN